MTDVQSTSVSTRPAAKSLMASVREKSTSDLTAAIRSPDDKREIDAMILERANTVLGLGYVPDWTPQERAAVLDEFRKALRRFPFWAVERAFDEWVRTSPRRPSPAEIAILVRRQIEPVTDELARRRKDAEQQAEEDRQRQLDKPSAETAKAILEQAGFTPKRFNMAKNNRMATTFGDLERDKTEERVPHWTETVDPDGPEMEELRKARDANPHVRAARETAARNAAKRRAAE